MIGVLKSNTVIGLMLETTENDPLDPASATDYIEVLEDGFEFAETKELVERNNLTSQIGLPAPRTSIKGCTGALPVEFKASGVEGQAPQYGKLLEAALGTFTQRTTKTTEAGSTTSTVNVTTHGYTIGDFVLFKISGGDWGAFVASVIDADSFTIFPPAPSPIPTGTTINASTTYKPTNDSQPTFTPTFYWGNTIKGQGSGCRVASLSMENFTTGQIANLVFGFEGLNYSREDGTSPFAPSYDQGLPPVVLGAYLSNGGDCIPVNELTIALENTLGPLTTFCSPAGKIASLITQRAVSGTFNPYIDDTTTEWFDLFEADTLFSLSVFLGNPDPNNPGEVIDGSAFGVYLPSVMILATPIGDLDGVLIDQIEFNANTGISGDKQEIFIGFS